MGGEGMRASNKMCLCSARMKFRWNCTLLNWAPFRSSGFSGFMTLVEEKTEEKSNLHVCSFYLPRWNQEFQVALSLSLPHSLNVLGLLGATIFSQLEQSSLKKSNLHKMQTKPDEIAAGSWSTSHFFSVWVQLSWSCWFLKVAVGKKKNKNCRI